MGYSKQSEEVFTYFSADEEEKIEKWLKDHGHSWDRNTVCGSCCGMYEDQYWVNGIGGEFPDASEFVEFAKKEGIGCRVYGYHIVANENVPNEVEK